MPEEQEGGTTLIPLFDRLAAGDTSAADEMIEHAMERLRVLAHKQLMSFPAVRQRHETDDIVQGAAMRLYRAIKAVRPTSVEQILRLASTQIRRELLDLKKHEFGANEGRVRVALDPAQSPSQVGQVFAQKAEETGDGEDTRLLREEFHERVGDLPEEERAVFEMIYYQGLRHLDVARALGISESTVKRRWYDAQESLRRLLHPEG